MPVNAVASLWNKCGINRKDRYFWENIADFCRNQDFLQTKAGSSKSSRFCYVHFYHILSASDSALQRYITLTPTNVLTIQKISIFKMNYSAKNRCGVIPLAVTLQNASGTLTIDQFGCFCRYHFFLIKPKAGKLSGLDTNHV